MNYKTHINGGILTVLCVVSSQVINTTPVSSGILVSGVLVGSILPDIDHKNSYISKRNKLASKIATIISGHRKLFHAPLMYLLLYIFMLEIISNNLLLILVKGLTLGVLSHLLLDSFTIGGLPLLYPISKKKFSLGKIKTNSYREYIFQGMLIMINIVIFLDILQIISII